MSSSMHSCIFPGDGLCVTSAQLTTLLVLIHCFYYINRDCNRRKHILSMSNELYASVYLQLYTVWKNEQKTIADSGYVLQGRMFNLSVELIFCCISNFIINIGCWNNMYYDRIIDLSDVIIF